MTMQPVPCAHCQRRPPPYDLAHAPLAYAFPVDALIKAFKFHRRLDLAPLFAGLLLPWLEARVEQFDALVPVPLHRLRNATRGYNQAYEIARCLKAGTHLPVVTNVRRTRRTVSQSGLDAKARRQNVRAAFAVKDFRFKHPLIIDDVLTTGETCGEIARVLKGQGAERVSVLCVARASSVRQ